MSRSRKRFEEPSHRNQVAREMIIERVGMNAAGPMKSGKEKRQNNRKRNWENEVYDFSPDEM